MNSVDQAFRSVLRANFLPPELKQYAGLDRALPIGFGQTNSQPSTVRMMLEWLDVKKSHRILDIGSGSGWTTALLSHIVGPTGHVYAVERIPELVAFGRENCRRLGLTNVAFYQAADTIGLPEFAPYDRILVSASADMVPDELPHQLKLGGKLVIPVDYDILEIVRAAKGNTNETRRHPGFIFVPLIGGEKT